MPDKLLSRILLFTLVTAFSIYIGFYLDDRTTPNLYGVPQITKDQATEKVHRILDDYGFKYNDYYEFGFYGYDNTGSDYLISKIGMEEFREIMEDGSSPLSFWRYQYYKNVPRDNEQELMEVWLSRNGKFLAFMHMIPDSASGQHISSDSALVIAKNYIKSLPEISLDGYTLQKTDQQEKEKRTDTRFTFEKIAGNTAAKYAIHINLSGAKVTQVRSVFREPHEANVDNVGGANILFNSFSIITYLFVTILGLVLFLRRYHNGLISVEKALWAGVVVYLVITISSINSWDVWALGTGLGTISMFYTKFIMLGLQMTISYMFIFANTFTSWANGDFELQDKKSKLLSGIDSVINRNFITRNIGREIPIGITYGAILFGILQLITYALIQTLDVRVELNGQIDYFTNYFPLLTLILSILTYVLFDEIVFRKFFTSYLKNKISSTFYTVIISGLVYAVFNIFFGSEFNLWPAYYTLIPYFILGLIQSWIFLRYGLLTSMTSGSFFTLLMASRFYFETGLTQYTIDAIVVFVIFAGITIVGIIGLFNGKTFQYTQELEPEHIRRIKERTRMQKELEIAKKVQLGLLPKEQPSISGFDIAGVCLPALEVGGDYFDFIHLQDGKLGIAIADVSGKGVPAAIYMTLTKGILQSHAEAALSPKTVLSKVNNLMYRTIDKSWYVSMFYAVIDPVTKKLTFSRAGHNPAIVLNPAKSDPQLLQPAGIGLGLEIGEIFTKTLVEGELQLESGNTLVFYTDGFTEAMSESEEEYGDERFLNYLSKNDSGTAHDLVEKSLAEIKLFQGEAPQHDDMTMVVLKVL